MRNDITIYSSRPKIVTFDEIQIILKTVLPNVEFLGNTEAEKQAIVKWFIALPPKPLGLLNTMQDSKMLVVDVTNDDTLASTSAKMLLFGLQQAEKDADSQEIITVLNETKQNFYSTLDFVKNEPLRKLTLVLSAALLKLSNGVLHEASNDEFITFSTYKTFVQKHAGEDFDEICTIIDSLP